MLDTLSLDRITSDRLSSVLGHAAATVPYYAALADRIGNARQLDAFPLLSKKEYVANLDALLSADYRRPADDSSAAHGTNPNALLQECTSGSSGYPMRTYKTVAERSQLALSLLRKRRAHHPGFSIGKLFGFIHNTRFQSTSYFDSLGNLHADNIGRVLTYLRDVERPEVLHGNPMLLRYYADYIAGEKFDLGDWRPIFIESVSEPLSPPERAHVAEQFRTRVVDCYGCLECYNLAYECPEGRTHINENVHIEIVDPETGTPLGEGQQGEVAVTSLVNRAQPFIRYKTGDLASVGSVDCRCGNRQPVITLNGRRKIDYLKLLYATDQTNLTICGYDFFATVMHRLTEEGFDCLVWFNVIQTELTSFVVQYIPKPSFGPAFTARFAAVSAEELGQPARIEFVAMSEAEVLLINKKSRVFRSLLQSD